MLIRIDPSLDQAIYEQIADSVRAQIAYGALAAGDRLPAARDLAGQLEVNLHTVLKAYQLLRDQGTVELRRGRGAVVTDNAAALEALSEGVDAVVELAAKLGVPGDTLLALVRTRLAQG